MSKDKEQTIENQIIAVSATYIDKVRKQNIVLWVLILFTIISFTIQFIVLSTLSSNTKDSTDTTKKVLTSQIPGLQKQIKDRDQTITDQQYELAQAVDAIKKLAGQVQSLGGDPGQITINPPKR